MATGTERLDLPWAGPVALGLLATAGTVVLLEASLLWIALVVMGLLVFLGSFVVAETTSYWLSVFLVTIPVNFTKLLFFTPEDIAALRRFYNIHQLENIVPVVYLADLPFLVLLLIWLGRLLTRRTKVEVPQSILVMLGFLVWCLVTLVGARAPEIGLTWIFFQLKMILILLWFVNASLDRRAVRLAVSVMTFSLAVQGALAVYTYFTQSGGVNVIGNLLGLRTTQILTEGPVRVAAAYVYEEGALLRGTGTVGVANHQAKYFVMLLPLAFASALAAARPATRLLYSAAAGLGLAGLFFTYSRGGLVTALIGLGVVVILMARKGAISKKAFVTLGALGLLAGALASAYMYRHLTTRPGYFDIRFDHVRYGAGMILERPLTGFGINNFNVSLTPYDYDGVFSRMPIHNHYLRLVLETGLPGLALYLAFFAWIAALAYRMAQSKDPLLSSTAVGLAGGLGGIFVYWTDDIFYDAIIRSQWWVLVALVLVIHGLEETRSALGKRQEELAAVRR